MEEEEWNVVSLLPCIIQSTTVLYLSTMAMTMARTYHHGTKNKMKLYGSLYWWYKQEPKWWRKLYKHKKRRAEWKKCLQRQKNGTEWDDIAYPKDKQPWIYYW